MKLSSLTKRERALAERIAGGPLTKSSDAAVLGVGFVLARRKAPTVALRTYELGHDADEVRGSVDWGNTPAAKKATPAKKTAAKKTPS